MAVDLPEHVNSRLAALCSSTGLPKSTMARLAIEAVVNAGEACGGRIVVPIEFHVRYLPVVGP